MKDTPEIYVTSNGSKIGPLSDSEFKDGIFEARYHATDPAWREGLPYWTTVGRLNKFLFDGNEPEAYDPARLEKATPQFKCPHCGQHISGSLAEVRAIADCPACGKSLMVRQMKSDRRFDAEADNNRTRLLSRARQGKWLVSAIVVVVLFLAVFFHFRSAATEMVRNVLVGNSFVGDFRAFTEHVRTRLHFHCREHLAGGGPHWHVTFGIPSSRLQGNGNPVSAEVTMYVSFFSHSVSWSRP